MLTDEQVKEIKQLFSCNTVRIITPTTKLFLLIGINKGKISYEKIIGSGYTIEEVLISAKSTLVK